MEIMVLPDGETYSALDGCSIRRVPDEATSEELDDLVAAGGGEFVLLFGSDRAGAVCSGESERRPIEWPARVWLVDVNTAGPPGLEVFFPDEGAEAKSFEAHEAYFSSGALRPLLDALERYANDPELGGDLGLTARDALARFWSPIGESVSVSESVVPRG